MHIFNVPIMSGTKLVQTPKGRTRSLYNSNLISIDLKINRINCYIFDITIWVYTYTSEIVLIGSNLLTLSFQDKRNFVDLFTYVHDNNMCKDRKVQHKRLKT